MNPGMSLVFVEQLLGHADTYHVMVASVLAPTSVATAIVQVGLAAEVAGVNVSSAQPQVAAGGTQAFAASVQNAVKPAVTWSCSGGSITSSGVYTAPSSPGTYTVTATLASDATIQGTATVEVSLGATSATLSYDANGNLVADGT